MKKITLSTDGTFRGREVQQVETLDMTRQYHPEVRHVVEVEYTPEQALAIAMELLYVAVDAELISGWNISFPEERHVMREDVAAVAEAVKAEIRG